MPSNWKANERYCSMCGYELLNEELAIWEWCFMCGNGSPVHAAILEATQRAIENVVPVLVRKNLRVVTRG